MLVTEFCYDNFVITSHIWGKDPSQLEWNLPLKNIIKIIQPTFSILPWQRLVLNLAIYAANVDSMRTIFLTLYFVANLTSHILYSYYSYTVKNKVETVYTNHALNFFIQANL